MVDRQTHNYADLRRLFSFTVTCNYYCITMTMIFFIYVSATVIAKNQDNSNVFCVNSSLIAVRSIAPPKIILEPFHTHGDAHSSSDAQRRHAPFPPFPLQSVQQGHQHPATRHTNGMSERDGTAADVHLWRRSYMSALYILTTVVY